MLQKEHLHGVMEQISFTDIGKIMTKIALNLLIIMTVRIVFTSKVGKMEDGLWIVAPNLVSRNISV